MDYRRLGESGLKVSSLCLGAMTFGEPNEKSFMHKVGSDEKTVLAMIERALAAGVNFIDTADVYGQDGLSERILGDWSARSKRRNDVVLATKFRFRMWDGPNGAGASRQHIMRAVDDSLMRLKTDRIELYQIHMQDLDTPEEETLRALDDLIRAGKVLYIGASNYAAYRLCDSLWLAKTLGLNRFVALQAQYSLVVRELEREHVPLCLTHGLGVLPWAPLAAGFLSGKYKQGEPPPAGTRLEQWKDRFGRYTSERNFRTLDAVRALAKEMGATPSQVALAWLMRKPAVASVIIGARSVEQLDDNLKAAELRLPDAAMARLDEVSALDLGYPYDFIGRILGRW